LLTKESKKKSKRFQELIDYFNGALFPEVGDDATENGMDDEEKALDDAIEQEDEGETEGKKKTEGKKETVGEKETEGENGVVSE
jgi:hypothetical protein